MTWPWRCRHWDTYRERRPLPGTEIRVLHFVCHYCGHAAPIMKRTPEEHARIVTERTGPMPTPNDPTPRPELEPDDEPRPDLDEPDPEDELTPPRPTPPRVPPPVPEPRPPRART